MITYVSEYLGYCKFGNFRKNFFFANSVKKTYFGRKQVMLKARFTYISKRQNDFLISRGFYFRETSQLRSFTKIKPSLKFLNLQ